MNSWKPDRALAGHGGEVGDGVADADEALALQLLLRPGEDRVGSGIGELERAVRLAGARQQGLVLVVEQLDGALPDRAGEGQRAVGLAHQRQVEAEEVVLEELVLGRGVRPVQDLVAVGEPAEAHDHRDVAVEDLVKGVERVVGREVLHRPAPFLHAQVLVLERLGMGQREAEEHPLDRPQPRPDADAQAALDQRQAARVAGVHLRRVAVHVAAELVEHDDERDQQARMLDVERPVVEVPARGQRHVGAEAVPDLLVGLLELAEPEVQALLDARPQHVVEHLLGLVDLAAARSGSARSARACGARAAASPSRRPTAPRARRGRRGSRAATAGCGGPSPGSPGPCARSSAAAGAPASSSARPRVRGRPARWRRRSRSR